MLRDFTDPKKRQREKNMMWVFFCFIYLYIYIYIIFLNFGSKNNLRAESETVKECLNGKRNLINDSR